MYRENWDNVQVEFFDPGVVGNIFYDTNGQNFLIKGVETSLVARVMTGLTLQGAASWNQSEQTNSPALIDNNNPYSGSVNYGKPITCVGFPGCAPITNPFGPIGAPSADAPPIQFSLRARYEWTYGDYLPFVQAGLSHTGHSFTQAGANPTIAHRGPHDLAAAVREPRVYDLGRLLRCRQGRLDAHLLRRKPEQLECQHLHQRRSVHRRRDAAAAAGNRGVVLVLDAVRR